MGDDHRAFLRKVAKAGFGDRDKKDFFVLYASKGARKKHKIYYKDIYVQSVSISPSDTRHGLKNLISELRNKLDAIDAKLESQRVSLRK